MDMSHVQIGVGAGGCVPVCTYASICASLCNAPASWEEFCDENVSFCQKIM